MPAARAQSTADAAPPYDPRITFAPLTLPDPVNRYRSSNGAPGPDFWQNAANYELHASLDTTAKQLRATEIVTYTNHSPDTLTSLWPQLDQNTYRKDSRARVIAAGGRHGRGGRGMRAGQALQDTSTDGFVFDSAEVESRRQRLKADYLVNDTRIQIRLVQPLTGHGCVVTLRPDRPVQHDRRRLGRVDESKGKRWSPTALSRIWKSRARPKHLKQAIEKGS